MLDQRVHDNVGLSVLENDFQNGELVWTSGSTRSTRRILYCMASSAVLRDFHPTLDNHVPG